MRTWGLTGGIGSGKSLVASYLRAQGIPVYDSDARAKALYDSDPELVGQIEASFQLSLRGEDGRLDRRKLATLVFADPQKRGRLEALVHPRVRTDFLRWRAQHADAPALVMESALLLSRPLFSDLFDALICVEAPQEQRLERVMRRDGLSAEAVRLRMQAQEPVGEPALFPPRYTLSNSGSEASLAQKVQKLITQIMDTRLERINAAAAYVAAQMGDRRPRVGIVLGSGLGKLADKIENPLVIPYKDIPGFPASTAIGHKGNFILGELSGQSVIAMQGRIHYYEGYSMDLVTLPIRVMIKLGIAFLFVSNAAGATNYHYSVGDLMIIKDHINLLPNPLIGPNMDEFGPRFPDMTRPYDPKLIRLAKKTAADLEIHLQEGVYVGCTGPSYETPAEYKFFRTIGADVVGMSTVPEVIVARQSDIPVFGMSVVTDVAHDDYSDDYVTDGDAIVAAADAAADKMSLLFAHILKAL